MRNGDRQHVTDLDDKAVVFKRLERLFPLLDDQAQDAEIGGIGQGQRGDIDRMPLSTRKPAPERRVRWGSQAKVVSTS